MMLPHRAEFRHGREIVFWSATAAGATAMLVPGEPYWSRMLSLPGAYFMVGGVFGGGWLIAHFFRLVLGWLSPTLAILACVFYFYGTLLGAAAMLLIIPLDPERPSGQELRELILFVPAALGVAAGTRYVLNRYAEPA